VVLIQADVARCGPMWCHFRPMGSDVVISHTRDSPSVCLAQLCANTRRSAAASTCWYTWRTLACYAFIKTLKQSTVVAVLSQCFIVFVRVCSLSEFQNSSFPEKLEMVA